MLIQRSGFIIQTASHGKKSRVDSTQVGLPEFASLASFPGLHPPPTLTFSLAANSTVMNILSFATSTNECYYTLLDGFMQSYSIGSSKGLIGIQLAELQLKKPNL